MNKIESGLKLDFNNILIRPKRSTLNSRSEVSLIRKFKFVNAKTKNDDEIYVPVVWEGTPIISANMDMTGTFEIYDVLSRHKIITALHKFYTVAEIISKCGERNMEPNLFMISTGISEGSLENLEAIFSKINCKWICIDIANGYISNLIIFCQAVRAVSYTHLTLPTNREV